MNNEMNEMIWETVWTVLNHPVVRGVFILVIAFVANRIIRALIRRRMKKNKNLTNRAETVVNVLCSAVSVVIYFLAILEICKVVLNINPATVIAATGVVGVGISFGAQNLVKDMISGFFILFENQYAVGEIVTIGAFTGKVVSLGVRSTRLQNEDGDLFMINNGAVATVVNHSRSDIKKLSEAE